MAKSENIFSKKNYFPTMVFSLDVANPEDLNDRLKKAIYAERDADQEGISRSNFKGLGGWHSQNNLHKKKEYKELVGHIGEATTKISDELGYAKSHELSIGTMWSIINPPGSSNRAHIHPGCIWSGVYYIQAPENSGNIEFTDPRTMVLMNQPKFIPNQRRPKDCWTKVNFTPVPGKMLIFPAWLYHSVNPNMSTEEGDDANRIIISFNLNQTKKS